MCCFDVLQWHKTTTMKNKFFGKYLLFPVLVFGLPALGMYVYGRYHVSALIVSNICLIIGALTIYGFERSMPFNAEWNIDRKDAVLDITYIFSNLVTIMLTQVTVLFAAFHFLNLGLLKEKIQTIFGLSLVAEFLVFYLVVEFLHYAYHWLEHRGGFLWKIHEIHHSSERVYSINSFKMHAFETAVRFVLPSIALVLVGGSEITFLLYAMHSAMLGILQHANIDMQLKGWNKLFSTADLHRMHHSKVVKESNHNFGKSITLYDIIFRTYDDSGLKHTVGVGETVPHYFWEQFLFPFIKKRK